MNEPRLYIALYFNADIQFQITAQIEKHGYDVVHAHALKHSNWTDEQLPPMRWTTTTSIWANLSKLLR